MGTLLRGRGQQRSLPCLIHELSNALEGRPREDRSSLLYRPTAAPCHRLGIRGRDPRHHHVWHGATPPGSGKRWLESHPLKFLRILPIELRDKLRGRPGEDPERHPAEQPSSDPPRGARRTGAQGQRSPLALGPAFGWLSRVDPDLRHVRRVATGDHLRRGYPTRPPYRDLYPALRYEHVSPSVAPHRACGLGLSSCLPERFQEGRGDDPPYLSQSNLNLSCHGSMVPESYHVFNCYFLVVNRDTLVSKIIVERYR